MRGGKPFDHVAAAELLFFFRRQVQTMPPPREAFDHRVVVAEVGEMARDEEDVQRVAPLCRTATSA